MKYCVYQITNNVNGKIYVGAHRNDKLSDYGGSGSLLLRAYDKYSRKNFTKEVLEIFDNEEDMFAREAEIVNEEFVADRNTYNLNLGGFGGPGSKKSEAHKQAISEAVKAGYANREISRNGGRSALTPNIAELVEEHGIKGAANLLEISEEAAKSRYYRNR